MTKKQKGRASGATPEENFSESQLTPIYSLLGWRGALAAGNGQFRRWGTYDTVATARRIRRRLTRRAAKRGIAS